MAKILCAYSGIEFQTEHFTFGLSKNECIHPVFYLEHKKLLAQISRWSAGTLSATETYLYFLALLNNTEVVEWRCAARLGEGTLALANNNMEALIKLLNKIHDISHPSFALAHISITPDTATLENIKYWIETWEANYADFNNGYRNQNRMDKVARREVALEKLIKNPFKTPDNYANTLASWARIAGDFPLCETLLDNGEYVPLADYWESIIKKCCNSERIFTIPAPDLEELITHCEDCIPHGSIYSHKLMQLLRNGRDRINTFLGINLGGYQKEKPSFNILSEPPAENANILAMISAAPQEKPERIKYPKLIDYLKAKACWDAAQEYTNAQLKGDTL